jgi:hypothetical protein
MFGALEHLSNESDSPCAYVGIHGQRKDNIGEGEQRAKQ